MWHLCFHFWVKKSLGRNDPLNQKLVWLKRLFYWLSIPVFNSLISDLVLYLMSFLSAQSAKVTHIGILGDSPLKKTRCVTLVLVHVLQQMRKKKWKTKIPFIVSKTHVWQKIQNNNLDSIKYYYFTFHIGLNRRNNVILTFTFLILRNVF